MVQHLFGVIFFRKCDIGGGLSLAHGTGLVINLKSMGERCALRQNTTIGIGRGGIPTIGNDVFIGPNSVIIGGITVGDGAIIGAGAVVIRDVPPSSIAVGNPARNLPIRPETERPPIY